MQPFMPLGKGSQTSEGAGTIHSLWKAGGFPSTGANPPVFSSSGYVPTKATAGAFPFTNPASGNSYFGHLWCWGATAGMLLFYDRVWACSGFSTTSTSLQTIANQSDAGRYSTFEGIELWLEVYTAPGATGATWTITYCVDDETECLTRRGWTKEADLRETDQILAWDAEQYLTKWETPREVFRKSDYDDEVCVFPGLGGLITTPNHRWPVVRDVDRDKDTSEKRIVVRESRDMGRSGHIPRGSLHQAPEKAIYSDAFVSLCAWYFTEGSRHQTGNGITVCQSERVNAENVASIRAALLELGARDTAGVPLVGNQYTGRRRREGLWFREYIKEESGCVAWNITGTSVDEITSCVVGSEKVPRPEFLCALTDDQLRLFVETSVSGDGTEERGLFFQHSKARMDAFMMAATLAGWAPSIDASGTTCALRMKQGRGSGRTGVSKIVNLQGWHSGTVWCPVTESGFWVARRNGKVFITGNTNQAGTTGKTATYTHPANAETVGQMMPVALANGDTGVRSVQSLQCSVSSGTAGDIGITLLRRLAVIPIRVEGTRQNAFDLGLERVLDDACIAMQVGCSATNTGFLQGGFKLTQVVP